MNSAEPTTTPYPETFSDLQEQVQYITQESLHLSEVGPFDPTLAFLDNKVGQKVVAIDIGGDKIAATEKTVGEDKRLHEGTTLRSGRRKHGENYLAVLENLAYQVHGAEIPVGISYAGPISGTRPVDGPNVRKLLEELDEHYAGNFEHADPEQDILLGKQLKAVANDAVAGLYAGAAEAVHQYPDVKNVIYLIVGSGFGGAVLKEGRAYAAEPGHIEVVPSLNPYGRIGSCGVFDQSFICMEMVAGGKTGIEAIWEAQTGTGLSGPQIAEQAAIGNELAQNLYKSSAKLVAATAEGIAKAMDLSLTNGETAIVFHGGPFNVSFLKEGTTQLLEQSGSRSPVLFTGDFSENACCDGAALAALAAMDEQV